MLGSAFSLLGALAVTIGLLMLAMRLLKRLQQQQSGAGNGPARLQLLQRLAVGPKQGVGLLRVGDRVLVISISEQGSRMLTELDGPEREAALAPAPAELPSVAMFRKVPMLARLFSLAALLVLLLPATGHAQRVAAPQVTAPSAPSVSAPGLPQVDIKVGEGANALRLSGAVSLVVFMGVLTLLPAVFLLMTSFTRILIVLHFLRSALGTQTTPPGQLLVAIAVLLTGVVMNPVLQETNRTAVQPYFNGTLAQADAYKGALKPFREFMLANTREQDISLFADLTRGDPVETVEDLPTVTIVSAFVTSELRTAFQMGFVIFLPFVVVDLIVASVLTSLGMFMLPPVMISLPFKLLLFVLADGWTLVVQNLVASFR